MNIKKETNFWEENQNLKFYFKDEYDKDSSKKKYESSQLLKAIYFIYHYNSEFYNLDFNNKLKVVSEIIPETIKYDFANESIVHTVEKFHTLIEDEPRKFIKSFEKKLKERREFIDKTKYLPEYEDYLEINGECVLRTIKSNAPLLEKMLLASSEMLEEHKKLKALLDNKKTDNKGKGDSILSLGEQGII
jgi:F0F1-type ATP synthase delta subunit